jgi:hypothetical protein
MIGCTLLMTQFDPRSDRERVLVDPGYQRKKKERKKKAKRKNPSTVELVITHTFRWTAQGMGY